VDSRLRESQLNLLGQLPAAKVTVTIHLDNGVPDRTWWLTAVDDAENICALWSDRTNRSPRGDLSLAELMVSLQDVFRLTRGDPSYSQDV
jgi:hypothetical protein